MKQLYLLATCLLSISLSAAPIRFAVLSDTHVKAPETVYDTVAVKDSVTLRDTIMLVPRTVKSEALQAMSLCAEDLRAQQLDFILHAGDMTENGDSLDLVCMRSLLDATELPYYVTSGNHETTWSRSALQDLRTVFDSVRFAQNINGMLFLGLNSGPVMRMSDGHISPSDTLWIRQWLDSLGQQPTFVITHYPLKSGDVDNWYDLTNILRQYNTQVIISGHYHRNKHILADTIDNVICRSTLPDRDNRIGYTIVDVNEQSIIFSERSIAISRDTSGTQPQLIAGEASTRQWYSQPLTRRVYPAPDTTLLPSYAVNDSDSLIIRGWRRQLPVSFYATPTERYGRIYIGDDNGTFYAIDMSNGRILWRYKTTRRIIGSSDMKDGRVVFASANGTIYCLSVDNGKLLWRQKLGKPVTGSVTISDNMVFVGSSDSCFYALRLASGLPVWTYRGFGNYCIARPLVHKNKVYVGAWDGNFYAFDKRKGKLLWRWNNGKPNTKLSPAAVTPCSDGKRVYIVAPDRYITALKADSGTVSFRTNRWTVRESLGMKDSILYAKTMKDTIIAINLKADTLLWATDAGYGYEHAPSQLIENEGTLFVTTKNGMVIALDALTGEIQWKHKVGNSLLATPCPLPGNEVVVASTDGSITLLRKRDPILPDSTLLPVDTLTIDSLSIPADSLGIPADSLFMPIDSTAMPVDTLSAQ